MKLQYIGTGAAEGFPGMFCRCEACRRARKAGGHNLKTRSCAMINDQVLIDLSPDLYAQSLILGLELGKVRDLVVTHTHQDHLDPFFLGLRARDGATKLPEIKEEENYLSVYGSTFAEAAVYRALEKEPYSNESRIRFVPVETGKWFQVGRLRFCPLKANHKKDELCHIYVVTDESVSLLYANDTGALSKETLNMAGGLGLVFEAVSMDCARGILPGDGHMGIRENLELKKQLEQMGCTGPGTRYYLNHLSHMSGVIHDDLQRLMGTEGFTVAYDGMIVDIGR
ncbi:MBL fold metallo-hydrolase [Lacrimispora indolis]|uniref:MBL fold metallo-hydrolase n=1 Tax=Lacrimispora indolis TaxID=69825 RepID=UPI0004142D4F|nr:MBL fold metallo-hydrolase [[Clostridium] methoxybenzovorans]